MKTKGLLFLLFTGAALAPGIACSGSSENGLLGSDDAGGASSTGSSGGSGSGSSGGVNGSSSGSTGSPSGSSSGAGSSSSGAGSGSSGSGSSASGSSSSSSGSGSTSSSGASSSSSSSGSGADAGPAPILCPIAACPGTCCLFPAGGGVMRFMCQPTNIACPRGTGSMQVCESSAECVNGGMCAQRPIGRMALPDGGSVLTCGAAPLDAGGGG